MLNCEFKSYRCNSYYTPVLTYLNDHLKPFILKESILYNDETSLTKQNFIYLYFTHLIALKTRNLIWYRKKIGKLSKFTIRTSKWFTKKTNIQKLYFKAHIFFLSSGMVVNSFKKPLKFLKKRIKIWKLVAKWYKYLFLCRTILWLNNLYGYKYFLIKFFLKKKIKFVNIFIQCFFLNFIFVKKKKKRIKRWIKKRYFSSEISRFRNLRFNEFKKNAKKKILQKGVSNVNER